MTLRGLAAGAGRPAVARGRPTRSAATPPPDGLGVGELLRRPEMWGYVATTASLEFCRGALFLSLLPAYLPARLGLSVAAVGLVVSLQYLADTLFKIPAGWLVDRWGPWRTLLPFVCLAALAVFLMPSARGLGAFLALAALFGFGTSANWPAVLTGSVHLAGLGSRASATSVTFLAWLAGGGVGPVLINFLLGHGWRLPFAVLEGVAAVAPAAALLGGTGMLRRPGDRPWRRSARAAPRATLAEVVGELRRVVWLLPGMYVQMVALGILIPILVPFARHVLHLTPERYGLLLLAGGSVTVLCLVPVGRLVDRIGSKALLVAGFALAAAAVVLLARGGPTGVLWRAALLGFSYALILPAWNGLTVGKTEERRRGLLLGVFMAIEGVGEATGPVIGGWLYTMGYAIPFYAVAGVLLGMAAFYGSVPARRFRALGEDGDVVAG
jgi:DHA1 family multidrug resistance protein-like MFS transporter